MILPLSMLHHVDDEEENTSACAHLKPGNEAQNARRGVRSMHALMLWAMCACTCRSVRCRYAKEEFAGRRTCMHMHVSRHCVIVPPCMWIHADALIDGRTEKCANKSTLVSESVQRTSASCTTSDANGTTFWKSGRLEMVFAAREPSAGRPTWRSERNEAASSRTRTFSVSQSSTRTSLECVLPVDFHHLL
jgi:hypothetical protein